MTQLNRQNMLDMIQNATDIPVQLRIASALFIARMTDARVQDMGNKAVAVLACVKSGDQAGFVAGLTKLGMPKPFVDFLAVKAFSNADHDKGD
jgi:hypothetical protein